MEDDRELALALSHARDVMRSPQANGHDIQLALAIELLVDEIRRLKKQLSDQPTL